jgi:hypothetical protein
MRTAKSNFTDKRVEPITVTYDDVFALNGSRLFLGGGTYGGDNAIYNKEQIDFTTITSFGVFGNGPKYFTVKDRSGTIYEYGNSVDSRILSNNGLHVISW